MEEYVVVNPMCPICLDVLEDPVASHCGHPICNEITNCPICRDENTTWIKSHYLRRICDDIKRKCPMCDFCGSKREIVKHNDVEHGWILQETINVYMTEITDKYDIPKNFRDVKKMLEFHSWVGVISPR